MRGLMVLVLSAVFFVPSTVAAAETVELAGTTTVSTDRSGQIRLSVPNDAVVDAASFATVTGDGGFFGVVLTRVGDDTSFKASHIRYPADGDFRYTSTSVRLDAQDADEGDPVNPFDVPEGRACVSDCRLPAGDYDLLVVADDAPVHAKITIEGLAGAVDLGGALLRPLRTHQVSGHPTTIEWGSALGAGAGGSVGGIPAHDTASFAYTTIASSVAAKMVGRFDLTFCVTVDDECAGSSTRHLYAANAVEGPEGLSSFGSYDLAPGDHGLKTSYSWEGVGGGSAEYRYAALFIHP